MNVICGFIETITATIELIGMGVGNLSIIWSWITGLLHCAEGTIINPAISTVCGPIIGGGGGALIGGGGSILVSGLAHLVGIISTQGLGTACNTLFAIISGLIPM